MKIMSTAEYQKKNSKEQYLPPMLKKHVSFMLFHYFLWLIKRKRVTLQQKR